MEQLKKTYIRNDKFSSHLTLWIAAKLYFVLSNIKLKSEIYKQFVHDKSQVSGDPKRMVKLTEEQRQEQIVLNFMNTITSSIEIVGRDNQLIIS